MGSDKNKEVQKMSTVLTMSPVNLQPCHTVKPDLMNMVETPEAPPQHEAQDTVSKGYWNEVKHYARKGADISSHALGGCVGLGLLGTGIYVGALGGALGGAYLGGGIGLLQAAATSQGFIDFWKTVFTTSTTIGKIGILAGGTAVGYGSWKLGSGLGSLVAAIPGAIIGGVCGMAIAAVNRLKGEETK